MKELALNVLATLAVILWGLLLVGFLAYTLGPIIKSLVEKA